MGDLGKAFQSVLHAIGVQHVQSANEDKGINGSPAPAPAADIPAPTQATPAAAPQAPMSDALSSLYGNNVDFMSTPAQSPALAPDVSAQQAPVAAPQAAMPDATPAAPVSPPENPYIDSSNPQDMAKDVGTPNDDMSITGFKPKSEHGLEAVADFFLGGRIHRQHQEDNLRSAMEGFTTDPENSIRKVESFNPKLAWAMQQNYLQEARLKDQADEKTRDNVSAMLGAATPQNYDKVLASARNLAEYKHMDPDQLNLPDTYDADAIKAWRYASYPTHMQIAQEHLDDYRGKTLEQRGEHYNATEAVSRDRLDNTVRHEGVTENIAKDRADRAADVGRPLMDTHGNQVGVLSRHPKYGLTATIISPTGDKYLFSITRDSKHHIRLGKMITKDPNNSPDSGVNVVSDDSGDEPDATGDSDDEDN